MEASTDLFHQRAQLVLKLLDDYLDIQQPLLASAPDLADTKTLPVLVQKSFQEPIANFLRSHLDCNVTYGKDHYGQANGYLMVSLDNNRLNQTGFYRAVIALQQFARDLFK
ncbi:MAG: hypothetical protein NXI01_06550 [Gammaproteobacteria bacterium]|nr:hypothetical protein [Gammaproteobacteria bacterium]